MGLDFAQIRASFFDSKAVLAALDKKERQALSKFGAFVRTRARSSIRRRKKSSLPGQPPSSHTGVLKRFLYFAYDTNSKSVVVGPVPTNQLAFTGPAFFRVKKGLIPEILEYGGIESIFEVKPRGWGFWKRADFRSRRRIAESEQRWRTIGIKSRPYMQPALAAELPKFAGLFKG